MGILIDNNSMSHNYINKVSQPGQNTRAVQNGKDGRNFDEILISANSRQIEEKKIAEDLAHKAMSQIRQTTPLEKLEKLETSILEGSYRIDPDALASRILLQRGEYADE